MKIVEETDYVAFCGGNQPDWEIAGLVPGKADERMSARVWSIPLKSTLNLIKFLIPGPAN